jgi:ABC-type transporter Mla subunit MlaD
VELNRAQKVRLGTFMATGITLIFLSLATLLGLRLWQPRAVYKARFKDSISGLERSAPVKYQGLRVGRVDAMRIARDDPTAIEVDLELETATVLYEGTECNLDMGGLTGLKSINLTAGDPRRSRLPPGTLLHTGPSLFDKITDNAAAIVGDVKRVADELAHWMNHDNRQRLESLLVNLDKFVGHLDVVMMDSSKPMHGLIQEVQRTTVAIGQTARAATGTLGRLSADFDSIEASAVHTLEAIERPLEGIGPNDLAVALQEAQAAAKAISGRLSAKEAGRALASAEHTLDSVNHLIQDVDLAVRAGREDFTASLSSMRQAAEDLREFSRILAQNPSVLVRGRVETD